MIKGQTSTKKPSRILVVDDEELVRQLLLNILRDEPGYEVSIACDGIEAQELLKTETFQVVITDLTMPRMGGLELMRWAQTNRPGPAWIVLTGQATVDNAVQAVHLGAFDFIRKPLDVIDSLRVTVRNALQQRLLAEERKRLHQSLARTNQELKSHVDQLSRANTLLAAQADTIGQDLRRAELIQRALLPATAPVMPGYSVHTAYRASHNVGGDLYELARCGNDKLAIYLADAAGHGVSAAMLAVLFKHRIAVLDDQYNPRQPAEVLAKLNQDLINECGAPGLFITALFGLLDIPSGELTIASAGHPPLLIQRANGACERIYHTGPALGFLAGAQFAQQTITLHQQDRIFLYTDGLFEARIPEDAMTGKDLQSRVGCYDCQPETVLQHLLDEATRRSGQEHPEDDITMVLLQRGDGQSTIDNGTPEAIPTSSQTPLSQRAQVMFGQTTDNEAVFALEGQANWTYCTLFHKECLGQINQGRPVRVDMSLCRHLDSTFLGTIYEVNNRAIKANVEFSLQGVMPCIRDLFEELGMTLVLDHISDQMQPLPTQMTNISSDATADLASAQRMLLAHETLANLSEDNRREFGALIMGLQSEIERMKT